MHIHIACSINKKYIQHLCAMIKSVVMNSKSCNVTIHILHSDVTESDKIVIKKTFDKHNNLEFLFYEIDKELLTHIPLFTKHLSIETLYRLLLPIVIPNNIEKIIYIDVDIIVKGDLALIFNINIQKYYLGAVGEIHEPILKIIGFNRMEDYFNAGFMLINLKKWRDDNFLNKCLDYAEKNTKKLIYADQDILNGVLRGDWFRLPMNWNVTRGVFDNSEAFNKYYSETIRKNIVEDPKLIHFTTGSKPWHLFDKHPLKHEYFYYLEKSGYQFVKYPELNIIARKKIVLFGASSLSEKITKELNEINLSIEFYVDNDATKWGTIFLDKNVNSPDCLKEECEAISIIIASSYNLEITQQLLDMGFIENKHFYKSLTDFKNKVYNEY